MYEFQSLVVLPAIRLSNLRHAIEQVTGDITMTQQIMTAVEEHLEVDAYRWGNACPKCGKRLTSKNSHFICPDHGYLDHLSPTRLLIAYEPVHYADG